MRESALDVVDWRRQVAALYADIRAGEDPAAAHDLWRRRRARLFAEHPASANRSAELRYAPYDPSLRFTVAVEAADPLRIELDTASDGRVPFERLGRVQLSGVGSLDVWWLASYGGGIWLPVRDANPDTYGGGRYVLDTVKGADLGGDGGRLVVDLNFAYNPSCAYDSAWSCPLAPAGNVIDGSIDAGELLPA